MFFSVSVPGSLEVPVLVGHGFGKGHETNMVREECIHPHDRDKFHTHYTVSINQRQGASAEDENIDMGAESTADMHRNNFRRFVKFVDLNGDAPVRVADGLTDENAQRSCATLEPQDCGTTPHHCIQCLSLASYVMIEMRLLTLRHHSRRKAFDRLDAALCQNAQQGWPSILGSRRQGSMEEVAF